MVLLMVSERVCVQRRAVDDTVVSHLRGRMGGTDALTTTASGVLSLSLAVPSLFDEGGAR
jgi:hypothetical protein